MNGSTLEQRLRLNARLMTLREHMDANRNDLDARRSARRVAARLSSLWTHRPREDAGRSGVPGPLSATDVV